MQALLDHPWPGNIRELDHAIERAVLMAQGDTVKAARSRPAAEPRRRAAPGGHEPRGRGSSRSSRRRWRVSTATSATPPRRWDSAAARSIDVCSVSDYDRTRNRRTRFYYERRIFLLAVLAGLPGSAVALIMLWTMATTTPKLQWTLTVLIVGFWLGFAGAVRERVVFPLRTLSNLLAALAGRRFFRARARRGASTTRWAK